MPSMMFRLTGSDDLSGVLDRIGDAARRLDRRLTAAAINGDAALTRLRQNGARNLAGLKDESHETGQAGEALAKTLISLAPAAIPAAAAMAPLAAGTAAAGLAAAAYGAALGPQIKAMTEAGEAEKKYTDAVEESGARSQAAVKAHDEYVRTVDKLPPSTRKAAAALSVFKDTYKEWSDSVADDTTAPIVKGMGLLGGMLPKLTPMARSFALELDRTFTIAGGAMSSPGLDSLMTKLDKFASGVLRRANDELVDLMRTADGGGKVGGNLSEFMQFAHEQGPVVADVLRNVGRAVANVAIAGADVGVGMLQAVDVLARIVAAVPPETISILMQLAVALRVAKLAAIGMGAARGAVAAFGTQLVAMQTAAAATPGRLAAVQAAIGALSRTAKIAVAGTGIGLLLILFGSLMEMGKRAPADLDRMTTSLGTFGRDGKLSGEAARILGSDFKEFDEALRGMARPGQLDQTQQAITSFFGMDSTPVKRWKSTLDDADKALANMVQNGNAELAAQSFAKLAKHAESTGMTTAELSKQLGDYRAALANQKFEQELAAASMGLFGAQAQQVQTKLDAQKRSADGLRQSLQALNDVQRQGLGGMIGFEAAIDAAAEAAKKNAGALTMSHGQLNLNSEKARTAASALNDLAAKTDEATASARESGASWSTVNGIYARGREKLIAAADAMGLTRSQAVALANQILKTPDKTARLKGNMEDLQGKLASAKAQLARVPDSRKAAVRATIADLTAKIAQAKRELAAMDGRTATASVMIKYRSEHGGTAFGRSIGGYATGGKPKSGEWAWVGEDGPELVHFKGGETVYDHGTSMGMAGAGMDAGRGLAAGLVGSTAGVEASARQMASAVIAGVRAELEIASPSKKTKALAADAGKGMILGLTGSKAKITAVSRDLVKDIWAAWKGTSSTKDSRLVAMVTRDTKKLQALATKRDGLQARISAGYKYAGEITASARQGAELGSLGLQPEEVTAGSIKAGLAGKLSQIKTFSHSIGMLAKKGLNKTLLRQILAMGPEAGYAYANALAAADRSTMSAVNSMQSQLDKATWALGRTGADAMYDSGKNAGKGFLTGLQSQQAAIEAQMLKIAKGMQAAIKKALGIKSPSTVMAELGRYSTEGLAVGLTQRLPVLDTALGAVTGRVAAARPVIGRPALAAGAGPGSAPIVVNIHVNGTVMDENAVAVRIQKALLSLKRDKGGALLGIA